MDARITIIGTATVLLEVGGLRIVTDPVLDVVGRVRVGGGMNRLLHTEQTIAPAHVNLDGVHAVLLSHHQHADNLDAGGLVLCRRAHHVITTPAAAAWLSGRDVRARGLSRWESTMMDGITITAVPARHGPIGAGVFVGACTGFVLEWSGQTKGVVYISGDTVLFDGVVFVGRRFRVGTALLHGGSAQFGLTGPLRFTMNAKEMRRAVDELAPVQTIPIHVDGWSHFQEGRDDVTRALDGARTKVRWLAPGVTADLDA